MKTVLIAFLVLVAAMSVMAADRTTYTRDEAKRILDTPIVRSSKGCVAFLGEDSRGRVVVNYPKDSKGNPICQRDLAYVPGQSEK